MPNLRTDILSRPELSGAVKVGDHIGIMNFYNLERSGVVSARTNLSQTDLLKWAASGRYSKLVEGQTSGIQAGAKSRCYAMVDVLRNFSLFDVTDNQLSGVINTLVSDNILTSGDQSAFNLLLAKTPASYAENLFNHKLTLLEISEALNV